MELPSQVSNTLWGNRAAKSAKVCQGASNQSLNQFNHQDLSRRAVSCSVCYQNLPQLSSISSLSVKGTPATQEKNSGPSTCLEARSPSKFHRCDVAMAAVVPFTGSMFQMDFRLCFCSTLLTLGVVHSLHHNLFGQPHATVAHHGLFQILKAKLCPP